jgi:hypothetical protein
VIKVICDEKRHYTKEVFLAKLAKEKEYRRKRYARTGK